MDEDSVPYERMGCFLVLFWLSVVVVVLGVPLGALVLWLS